MSAIEIFCDVICPHCDSPVEIQFGDNLPGIQNGCLTRCDVCDEAFCLIPTPMCVGCPEWLSCAKYSFVNAIDQLVKDGLVKYDVKTRRISVK